MEREEVSKASPQAANRKTDFCRKVGVSMSDDNRLNRIIGGPGGFVEVLRKQRLALANRAYAVFEIIVENRGLANLSRWRHHGFLIEAHLEA
ncbi:hypothetical protein [Martelella sp. AMO21009]